MNIRSSRLNNVTQMEILHLYITLCTLPPSRGSLTTQTWMDMLEWILRMLAEDQAPPKANLKERICFISDYIWLVVRNNAKMTNF